MQTLRRLLAAAVVIGLFALLLSSFGCVGPGRSSATHLIMQEIRKIAEADAMYGKETDVDVQVHSPVANVSIKVKTKFRDGTTPAE